MTNAFGPPEFDSRSDPRQGMSADALAAANQRALPQLPRAPMVTPGVVVGGIGVALLGLFTFSSLSAQRAQQAVAAARAPVTAPAVAAPAVAPSTGLPPSLATPAPRLMTSPPPPEPLVMASATPVDPGVRLKAPAIVVDLTKPAGPDAEAKLAMGGGSADEQFADRVAQAEARPARAVRLSNNAETVPQGSVIVGVLETAINSDLPGYVRAVVSRDVRSFDGSKVLIPTGSRLIGQYKSGLADGQSRAFVIWTRLIRPDGVSVQIASPVTDPLGRAGLGGKVDSHFIKRFGSAILLSVVGAGTTALAQRGNPGILVQSAQDAQNVAGIALSKNINIPPTVKVPPGAPIRIFIARDLDFAGVAQ